MRKKSRQSSRIAAARRAKRANSGLYIPEKYWKATKPYQDCNPANDFYFGIANEVYMVLKSEEHFILEDILASSYLFLLACNITSYYEDKVSDLGIWKAFIDTNMDLYGYALPFYNLDDYDPKGINIQDIQYLLWHRLTKDRDNIMAPNLKNFSYLAESIFSIFEKSKSKAKKNTRFKQYFTVSDNSDLYPMRATLQWLATQSYLIGGDLRLKFNEDLESSNKKMAEINNEDYIFYMTMEDYGYSKRSSFSSLSAPEVLSRIAIASDAVKENIKTLSRHMGVYIYRGREAHHHIFQHAQTSRTYRVTKDSVAESAQNPLTLGQWFYMSLIWWQGEWWLTGMMSGGVKAENMLEEQREKPLSDKALWSAEQKETALKSNQEQYEVFLETFGGPYVEYQSKKAYREDAILFQQNLRKKLKKVKQLAPEDIEQIENVAYAMTGQLDATEFGVFFSPIQGMQLLFNVPYVIELMKKPNPTHHEKKTLFFRFIEDGFSFEFLKYLMEQYPTDNLQFPLENYPFDVPKHFHFLRRFFHPNNFGSFSNLPNIALVNYKDS